jgi:hypothetical protein
MAVGAYLGPLGALTCGDAYLRTADKGARLRLR